MQNLLKISLAFVVFGLVLTQGSYLLEVEGATIYSNDFNADPGSKPAGQWDKDNNPGTFTRESDTGNIFGTSNFYADWNKAGTDSLGHRVYTDNFESSGNNDGTPDQLWSAPASGITTMVFDYYEPSGGGSKATSVRLGNGLKLQDSGTSDRFSINIDDGAVGGVAGSLIGGGVDERLRFELVANHSGAALTDYHLDYDLANNRADLFVYRYANDTRYSFTFWDDISTDDGDIENNWSGNMSAAFLTFSGTETQRLFIDNFAIHDEVFLPAAGNESFTVIPEPSSAMLVLLGIAFLMRSALQGRNKVDDKRNNTSS